MEKLLELVRWMGTIFDFHELEIQILTERVNLKNAELESLYQEFGKLGKKITQMENEIKEAREKLKASKNKIISPTKFW